VEDGRLERVAVEGWKQPAYIVPGAKIPRAIDARAIVSPFDPVLWERKWTKSVFDFEYQIEIYVPAPKRIYGYYVLPLLWGDALVGRLDLKADRKDGALLVLGSYGEPGVPVADVVDDLAPELLAMARWLGLERVDVRDRGDLALPLRRAVDRYARVS